MRNAAPGRLRCGSGIFTMRSMFGSCLTTSNAWPAAATVMWAPATACFTNSNLGVALTDEPSAVSYFKKSSLGRVPGRKAAPIAAGPTIEAGEGS